MKGITPETLFAAAYPDIEPRLVIPQALMGRLGISEERQLGTYDRAGTDVIQQLRDAGLRGRGGAGFPASVKWDSVAEAVGEKVVVANGEEGEPSSMKDLWLMLRRPHLVLDGLLLAAQVTGATRVIVYVSSEDAERSMADAINALYAASIFTELPELTTYRVAPTYVAGEETAVCQAISGGPALPKAKPPRPSESGVDGLPTLVSNVETLAHAAWIHRNGAEAYRRYGTQESPGTTLITLGGVCYRPGVYEIPFGVNLREVFIGAGNGFSEPLLGVAMGGWFGGLLDPESLDLICSFESCKNAGSGWGCGSLTALGHDDTPLAFAARVAAWYQHESAQQCGVCIKGTAAIANAVQTLYEGRGSQAEIENLARWATTLRGKGACAFLDGAALLGGTLVRHFSAVLASRNPAISASEAQENVSRSDIKLKRVIE